MPPGTTFGAHHPGCHTGIPAWVPLPGVPPLGTTHWVPPPGVNRTLGFSTLVTTQIATGSFLPRVATHWAPHAIFPGCTLGATAVPLPLDFPHWVIHTGFSPDFLNAWVRHAFGATLGCRTRVAARTGLPRTGSAGCRAWVPHLSAALVTGATHQIPHRCHTDSTWVPPPGCHTLGCHCTLDCRSCHCTGLPGCHLHSRCTHRLPPIGCHALGCHLAPGFTPLQCHTWAHHPPGPHCTEFHTGCHCTQDSTPGLPLAWVATAWSCHLLELPYTGVATWVATLGLTTLGATAPGVCHATGDTTCSCHTGIFHHTYRDSH
ncbi:hypothetical protein GPJ56_004555 [Histomonas meleagridis]|nr:hypothetical protein GPJ56_004555 [Histomonas meleagridis]